MSVSPGKVSPTALPAPLAPLSPSAKGKMSTPLQIIRSHYRSSLDPERCLGASTNHPHSKSRWPTMMAFPRACSSFSPLYQTWLPFRDMMLPSTPGVRDPPQIRLLGDNLFPRDQTLSNLLNENPRRLNYFVRIASTDCESTMADMAFRPYPAPVYRSLPNPPDWRLYSAQEVAHLNRWVRNSRCSPYTVDVPGEHPGHHALTRNADVTARRWHLVVIHHICSQRVVTKDKAERANQSNLRDMLLAVSGVSASDSLPQVPFTAYGMDPLSATMPSQELRPYVVIRQMQLLGDTL